MSISTRPLPLLSASLLGLGLLTGSSAWAGCSSLKSGDYSVMIPLADLPWRTQQVTVDAVAMTVDDHQGNVTKLSPAGAKCAFTLQDEVPWTLYVSPNSLFAGTRSDGVWMVGVPTTPMKIKGLAGTWNFMRVSKEYNGQQTYNGVLTISDKGKVKVSDCGNGTKNAVCSTPQSLGTLVADPAGGYTVTDSSGYVSKFYVTTNKDGVKLLIATDLTDAGAFAIGAPQTALSLPTVGETWGSWDFDVLNTGLASPVTTGTMTITSVKTSNSSYKRTRTEDCRVDTWLQNNGRAGVQYRPAGTFTKCDGTTQGNFGERLALGLRKLFGINAAGWTAPDHQGDSFSLSIIRP